MKSVHLTLFSVVAGMIAFYSVQLDPNFNMASVSGIENGKKTRECPQGEKDCACLTADGCDNKLYCKDNLVCNSSTKQCRDPISCAKAGCAANQVCKLPSRGADAVCLPKCLPGYTWDSSTRTCQTTDDKKGGKPISNQDFCKNAPTESPCDPEKNQAWNPYRNQCITCRICEQSNSQTGELYPVTTRSNHCICTTKEGYFYDDGALKNKPCDADGDGWVRHTARYAFESPKDCAHRENARCKVRAIDTFVLHSDEGTTKEISLDPESPKADPILTAQGLVSDGQLQLYEIEANDSFKGTRGLGLADELPDYQTGGSKAASRALHPKELNSLTKACGPVLASGSSGDYNTNKVSDLGEWQGMVDYGLPGYRDWLKPFFHFSYYIELYEGWYEGPESAKQGAGTYHIREKSRGQRSEPSTHPIPLTYREGEYWRSCYRLRSGDYLDWPNPKQPNVGMDFARYSPKAISEQGETVGGTGHHSQFQCVKIVNNYPKDNQGNNLRRENPHLLSVDDAEKKYIVNECHIDTKTDTRKIGPANIEKNPSDPPFKCSVAKTGIKDLAKNEELALVAVKYQHYDTKREYIRGCINECMHQAMLPEEMWCGGYHPDPQKADATRGCTDDPKTGKLICTCAECYEEKDGFCQPVDCGANAYCTGDNCQCNSGWGNCNDNWTDGCETNLNTNSDHCGSCRSKCGPHANCTGGACQCNSGWGNCNDNWADGCETNLHTEHDHCGSCTSNCGPNANCTGGACQCNSGWDNCNNTWADGCETNLQTDSGHCGSCTNACPALNRCKDGVCQCAYRECNEVCCKKGQVCHKGDCCTRKRTCGSCNCGRPADNCGGIWEDRYPGNGCGSCSGKWKRCDGCRCRVDKDPDPGRDP